MLNNNPGTSGDQELRITGIEKKVNDDGSIDIVISREGISDKTISSKGLTTLEFDEEVFNTLNTFDIGFDDALDPVRNAWRFVWPVRNGVHLAPVVNTPPESDSKPKGFLETLGQGRSPGSDILNEE